MTVEIFIPDIPEFESLRNALRDSGQCRVEGPIKGYWRAVSDSELRLQRKALGFGPALWNSLLSGGFRGRITEYGRDQLCIESESS